MRLLILDNRDSFTYNLAESFRKIGVKDMQVWRAADFDERALPDYQRIVLGPGPGLPADHPVLFDLLRRLQPHQSVLGVCMGHEALAVYFGGRIQHLNRVYHGDVGIINWTKLAKPLDAEIPNGFEAGLYHSWIVEADSLPADLAVTARSADGLIMGIRHRDRPLFGFQFHPESFITKFGLQLLRNWYFQNTE